MRGIFLSAVFFDSSEIPQVASFWYFGSNSSCNCKKYLTYSVLYGMAFEISADGVDSGLKERRVPPRQHQCSQAAFGFMGELGAFALWSSDRSQNCLTAFLFSLGYINNWETATFSGRKEAISSKISFMAQHTTKTGAES